MSTLETRLNYKFKNKELLNRALTHKSYANEMKQKIEHNEKLEFIGDAVLALVVGDLLYHKFPADTEGGLSKKRASMVNEEILSSLGHNINLKDQLQLGKGEMQTGGATKPRLIASCFEALLGAIYLDGGYSSVEAVVVREFESVMQETCGAEDFAKDYKTRLQEWVQKSLKETPKYEVLAEDGPAHDRSFQVCVKVKEEIWAVGNGRSKKHAEQMAACEALELKCKESPKNEL